MLSRLSGGLGRVFPPLPPLERWQRRALVAVLLVAALLRIGWAVFAAEPPAWDPLPRDPGWYLHLGENVADGKGYAYITVGDDGEMAFQATGYYPPGYPLVLGAAFAAVDLLPGEISLYGTAVAVNVVLSLATVGLVFMLGRRLAGPLTGLGAAAVLALWPNAVFHSGVVLTETLALFLLTAMFLVALASAPVVRAPGWRRLLTTGVLLGALGLVRPTSLVLAPVFLLLWWPWGVKATVRNTALVAVGALLVILPWTARNQARLGEPVLISTNTGDNLCIGYGPEATGGYNQSRACFEDVDEHDVTVETRAEFDVRRQSETMDRALEGLRDDPLRVVTDLPTRARYTLDSDEDGVEAATDYRRRDSFRQRLPGGGELQVGADAFRLLGNVGYAVIAALAVGGAVVAVRSSRRGRSGDGADADSHTDPAPDRRLVFVLAASATQLLSPLLTFGDERFKMPIYPAVAVLAGIAVAALVTSYMGTGPPSGAEPTSGRADRTAGGAEPTPVNVPTAQG